MAPTTPEEWWKSVDDNWPDLLNIMAMFLPMAALATRPPNDPDGSMVSGRNGLPMLRYQDVEEAKANRDHYILLRYFNGAWGAAPDDYYIHSIPCWHILCDLCSEEWVFEDQNANQ